MTTGVHNCEGRHSDPRDVTREAEMLIGDRHRSVLLRVRKALDAKLMP